jgi:hypothetical protein
MRRNFRLRIGYGNYFIFFRLIKSGMRSYLTCFSPGGPSGLSAKAWKIKPRPLRRIRIHADRLNRIGLG